MSDYKKYCYWVDFHGLKAVKRNLEEKEIELLDETHIPCRVLRSSTEVKYVAPIAWEGFCKRRTSWFRKSERTGKFLIVSNSPIDIPDSNRPIIIKPSDFKPDRLPSFEEISQMIRSQQYQKRKPSEWDKPDPLEKELYQKWFDRYQTKEPFDFEKILMSHSANHANFIEPVFFVDTDEGKIPYSIGDSLHVCSSCLEFFNILGEQWPVKYVLSCIGAVQFAHLPMDQYLKICYILD